MICKKIFTLLKYSPYNFQVFFDTCRYSQLNQKILMNSNVINIDQTNVEHRSTRKKYSTKKPFKPNQEVAAELISNSGFDINDFPDICLKKTANPSFLYILNKIGATQIASKISQELIENNTPIHLIQPGPGLLTEALLEAGVPKITVYEKLLKFEKHLRALQSKYPERIDYKTFNLMQLPQLIYIATRNSNDSDYKNVLDYIASNSHNQQIAKQVIGTFVNHYFFRSLFFSDAFDEFRAGPVIIYAFMFPSMLYAFEDTVSNIFHTPNNIILRILYNYKFIDKIPRRYFFPWSTPKKFRRNREYYSQDNELMYLVRLESKPNLFTEDFTQKDCYHFFRFLKFHMRRRDSRVIPILEMSVPGCGPRLIKYDFNIYTRFSDLTSQKLLKLFKIYRSTSGYETSPFINHIQTYLDSDDVQQN